MPEGSFRLNWPTRCAISFVLAERSRTQSLRAGEPVSCDKSRTDVSTEEGGYAVTEVGERSDDAAASHLKAEYFDLASDAGEVAVSTIVDYDDSGVFVCGGAVVHDPCLPVAEPQGEDLPAQGENALRKADGSLRQRC